MSLLANHFPALHGMRVLAILGVIQIHVTDAMVRGGLRLSIPFAVRSYTAFFGMDLFFILSGLLIGTILLHAIEVGGRERSVWRFYARRSFRIFPLYYVILTALVLLSPINRLQRHNLIYEYTYLTNYVRPGPITVMMPWGWSLCLEEHFYLAAPFLLGALAWLRTHRARIAMLVVLWMAGLAVRLHVLYSAVAPWTERNHLLATYVRTHTRFDILIAGVFLAYVQRTWSAELRRLFTRRVWRWAFAGFGWAFFLVLMNPPFNTRYYFLFRTVSYGTLTTLMYLPWILVLLNSDGWVVRILSHRFFLVLATLGYGIYLVHLPIIEHVMVRTGARLIILHHFTSVETWWILLGGTACLSTGVAYVLHLVVEKPALYLRDRFAP